MRERAPARRLAWRLAAALLALGLPALARAQTPNCGTILASVLSLDTPTHTAGLDTGDMTATDNYVYALTKWGFLRSNITTPGSPQPPELLSVFHAYPGDNGKVNWFCDCHQGGTAFSVAEASATDARLISDSFDNSCQLGCESTSGQPQQATMPAEAGQVVGGAFVFGQQVNVGVRGGSQLASAYIGGRYYAYMSNPGVNAVKVVDLTSLTGQADSSCDPPFYQTCHNNPASAKSGLTTTLSGWTATAMVARQVLLGGQNRFLLVGTKSGQLAVAEINGGDGQPTEKVVFATHASVARLDVANVNGRTFIFTAENAQGLRVYEVTWNAGAYAVTDATPSSPAVSGTVDRVVVRGAVGMAAPLIFVGLGSPSQILIYDSGWLTQGGIPRLGQTLAHLGKFAFTNYVVTARSFGARVVQTGPAVTAYVYELTQYILGNPGDPSFEVLATPVDVSCIATDPTAPAQANIFPVNKSAALRSGAEALKNYYGDRWVFRDTTITGVPLINVGWDLYVRGSYAADLPGTGVPPINWAMSADGTVPQALEILDNAGGAGNGPGILWPCDPAFAGDPTTGTLCNSSVNGSPSGGSYGIGIQTKNTNPPGNPTPSTYVAPAATVLAPQARVVCPPGDTVCQGGGALTMLSGDRIDASASDGNILDASATIHWDFVGCLGGCSPPTATGVNPVAPTGASGYTLTITYGDDYAAPPHTGAISQRDLVASFTITPSSVLKGTPYTLRNTMRTNSGVVTSVAYTLKNSGGVSIDFGQLPASFFPINGTASLTAPITLGNYTIELTYTFNGPSGSGQVQGPLSMPFTVIDWAAVPAVNVFTDAAGTIPASFFPPPTLTINTTYYVKDTETVPGGITYPGATYYWSTNASPSISGDTQIGSRSDQSAYPWTPTSSVPGLGTFYVKAAVGGVVSSGFQVIVATSQPLFVQVSGPSTGSVSTPLTFGAIASGGVAPYTLYQWDCDFSIIPNYVGGGPTQQCTYTTNGNHVVLAKVTDSAGGSATGQFTVSIGGGGGALSATINVSPASPLRGTPVTFTAVPSGGVGTYSYRWKPGDAPTFETWTSTGSNPNFTYVYGSNATYTVNCEVTSGSSVIVVTKSFTVTGTASPSAAYTIQGATVNGGAWDAPLGSAVTFAAVENPANVAPNGYSWDFADGSPPQHSQQVSYVFTNTGPRSVSLTVVGDGVNRAGTAQASIAVNVVPPAFQALIVPAAEHQPVPNTGGVQYFRTDVTVGNPGTLPVTVSPAYLDFLATLGNFAFDLSTVPFDPAKKVTIPPKGSWSQADVVQYLSGDAPTKGTLVLKYEGGDATPLVTARVYAAPTADPIGPSAGTTLTVVRATKDGQIVPQGAQVSVDQSLPGLRSDSLYYFRLSLVNSAGLAGMFHLTAFDQDGNPVTLKDPRTGGTPVASLDFPIGPYQGVDWSGDDLGLNDPNKRYILKAGKTPTFTTGQLMAFVKLNDRLTGDPVLVTPDTPPIVESPCAGGQKCINYIVPGARRFLTPSGAHWKTAITIYNPSPQTRGLSLTYNYSATSLLPPEKTASQFVIVGPGKLATLPGVPGTVCCDDAIAQLFATPANGLADFATDSTGEIVVQHFEDPDTSTAPLIILSRTYDDEPTGTVGSQLSVYTAKKPLSVGPSDGPLVLTGLQTDTAVNPKPRFASTVNVFAYDDVLTVVRLTALKSDGTVLGTHYVALNNPGASGHFQPRFLDASDATGSLNGAQNEPVSIKVEVVQGGHVGAYGLVEDLSTHDPTYIQSAPQN